IPLTQASISEISSVLEESEREDFVRMKTAKKQKIKREG
ncbi:MAG TPA: V-type ATP synthase subunit D, partial [Thermovirga lienii]|nr:V-type ATP synthase subunit D [Thermovirga lienii]